MLAIRLSLRLGLQCECPQCQMTEGFLLHGAGAETLIFVTGTSGKYPKICVSRQKIRRP